MENKVLFLDFDGVLFDTLQEVYLINRCASFGIDLFEPVDKENYKLYSKYKYLVYNIWMFYYYNSLIFDCSDESQIVSKFNELILKRDVREEEKFCRLFLSSRSNLVRNHFEFWKNLETPYEFFFGIVGV